MPIAALRSELEVRVPTRGDVEIRDPRLFQMFTVDRPSFHIAQAFDGRRSAEALAAGPLKGVPLAEIQGVAADFEARLLLDTAEARAAEPSPDSLLPPRPLRTDRLALAPVAHPEARWACHACGACCHGFVVELSPEEDARIDGRLYQDILGGEDWAEEQFLSADEPAARILRQRADRKLACIFLLEDGRCAIHARQGAEAKPNACRVFPFTVLKPPRQPPRLGLRLNCQSLYKSWEDGPPAAQESPGIFDALRGLPILRAPQKLDLFGKTSTFSAYEAVANELLSELSLRGLSALPALDQQLLEGRVAGSRRRYGAGILRYVQAEAKAAQLREGASFAASLARVKRGRAALEAMRSGRKPAPVPPRVEAFLLRQLANAIYLGAPLHAPDAGVGLVLLGLGLEAATHAIGPRGTVEAANHAIDVFTLPLIETEEHLWPFLEAVDRAYALRLKRDLLEHSG
ncbi:MAG: YkgJ family cysteine cluster protein [Myxococcota bacterium]